MQVILLIDKDGDLFRQKKEGSDVWPEQKSVLKDVKEKK